MSVHWHCFQIQRGREQSAAREIGAFGFEVCEPMMPAKVVRRGHLVDTTVPRFPGYMLAAFDRDLPGWQNLLRPMAKRAGIVKVMCDSDWRPIIVPDEAMEAVRAYRPQVLTPTVPYRFTPGEPANYTSAGRTRQVVFVGYDRNRLLVRMWILGAERVTEVAAASLEPVNGAGDMPFRQAS